VITRLFALAFCGVFRSAAELAVPPASSPAVAFAEPPTETTPLLELWMRFLVNPKGAETTAVVEYGIGDSFDRRTPSVAVGSGIDAVPVEFVAGNLRAHAAYRYRIIAANAVGTTISGEGTFVGPNTPPTRTGDRVPFPEAGAFTFPPGATAADPDNDPLSVIAVTQGQFGSVTFTPDSVTYTPGPTGLRADHFTYTVADGYGGAVTADVNVDLPVSAFRGKYSQLLTREGIAGGKLNITISPGGDITGRLFLGTEKITIAGLMTSDGIFRATLDREDAAPVHLDLGLRVLGDRAFLGGSVDDGTQTWSMEAADAPGDYLLPRGAHYTLAGIDSQTPEFPRGDAWAVFKCGAGGRIRLAGRFADGAAFTANALLQPDGTIPLYISRTDSPVQTLAGMLRLSRRSRALFDGTVAWTRAPLGSNLRATSSVVGGRVQFHSQWQPIVRFREPAQARADVVLFSHVAGFPIWQIVRIDTDAIVPLPAGAEGFRLSFSRTDGMFRGAFTHPILGSCRIRGVLVQPENVVRGNFFGDAISGGFRLTPR
jgi:hypothetical protein